MKRSFMATGRKVLVSVVSAAMVVAFTPVVAWGGSINKADETDPCAHEAAIGDVHYDTLEDAISAINNGTASGSTISLLSNVECKNVLAVSNDLTLEGNDHTIETSANRALWVDANDVSVSLKDTTFKGTSNTERGVQVNLGITGVKLSIDNCSINCTYYGINVCNDASVELSVSNSTISGWSALNLWSAEYAVTVENSKLIGINDKSVDEEGWNNFGTIVLEGDTTGQTENHAELNTVILNNCEIEAHTQSTNKQRPILFNSKSKNNKVYINGNSTVVNTDAGQKLVIDNGIGNEVIISAGLFDNPAAYSYAANTSASINVTLDEDYDGTIQVPSAVTSTLDLNGHNITTDSDCAIVNKGNLTIKGSGNVSTTASGSAAIANFPGASCTLNGGVYKSDNWYVLKNLGSMKIDGAVTVTTDNTVNPSSLIDNGWVSGTDTVAGEGIAAGTGAASLVIESGDFIGSSGEKSCSVVKNDDYGTLTINGGTFDSTANNGTENATTVLNWNIATINGGTFKGMYPVSNGYYGDADKGELTINGGTFTGVTNIFGQNGSAWKDAGKVAITGGSFDAPQFGGGTYTYSIEVTGGTFTADPSAYVKSGYYAAKSSDTWTVQAIPYVPETPVTPPAEVGDKTEGVELPSTPGESGSTGGTTTVDITVTDTTATTDSKGNKVDGAVSIDKIETTASSVSIPETITTDKGTFLVTSIPAEAMKDNTTVESITIPESITSIGESAFAGCTELTSVTVPAGVTEIKDSTFAGCTNLETVEVQGEVTAIAPSAFEDCTSLTSINVPDTVTTIGESAFAGCTSLTSVSVPAGVTTIESSTFAGCTNLTTVEIKGEVTEIAADAFNGCTNLTGLTTSGGIKPLAAASATTGKLVIPASITKIGDRAFKGTGITSVTIPAGVKMGSSVFRDCKQLTKASIEKGVKSLSSYTFKGCSALKSVTVPSGVTKIERSVFSGCKNLTKVTLPKTVTSIGKNALYGASKAKTLTINSKKLTKSGVKGSLAGSKVTTVKVPKSMVSAYKKIFTKANCGKTVKVRAI